ncbi:response regulator transcription factor [Sphingobacterium sp.]|uniref:LytR/AlgR family response regulator transcription factor n=1 Tax=Sphingobacterium sp. TaxID=341027 RepID=UPI00289EB49C|nr:response regulator transcription factor [Sphingobacterium sp.]
MNVWIVDDEPIAHKILMKYLEKVPSLTYLGSSYNGVDGIEALNSNRVDIVLLDIEMPEISGFDFLNALNDDRIAVIFTTAYSDYAIKSYDYAVIDYLLKPISFERFLKAINKAIHKIKLTNSDIQWNEEDIIWVKEGKKMLQISKKKIVVVRAMKDYMEVFLLDGKKVIIHITMSRLEQILNSKCFIRVSRSHIVRKEAIISIQDQHIEVEGFQEGRISVGGTYWDLLKRDIKNVV